MVLVLVMRRAVLGAGDQPQAHCEEDSLGAAPYLELGEDVVNVSLHGILRNTHVLGYSAVGESLGKQAQDVYFTPGQWGRSFRGVDLAQQVGTCLWRELDLPGRRGFDGCP